MKTGRRLRLIPTILLIVCITVSANASGTIRLLQFKSNVTPPPCKLPSKYKNQEPVFRASLKVLPEGLLVVGALALGSGTLGLSTDQSTSLTPLVTEVYTEIYKDSACSNTPSALPYCFSAKKPSTGQYFMYKPEKLPDDPTCIVFLHGYGGNFTFYTWLLKEEFPDAIILAPSWNISWHRGSAQYIHNMLKDAERRVGIKFKKRWLMGISAGGRGGFLMYNQMHKTFKGYVCIANAPETRTAQSLKSNLNIMMLNGTSDKMVPLKIARQQMKIAKKRVPSLRYKELKGNHFFILSNRDKTFKEIRSFMK